MKNDNPNGNTKKRPKSPKLDFKSMELKRVVPLTGTQRIAFEGWEDGQDLVLAGYAGTGKTYIAMYFALTMNVRVYVVRSAVPTRDMGFMPGNAKEKASLYEGPYIAACSKLFGRGDAYEVLSQKGVIEFVTTSYLRGLTLDDCVVIVDEMQNLNFHELDTVITRAGENCRMVFLGDVTQSDLQRDSEKAGLKKFLDIIERIDGFDIIDFGVEDIVRSERVKQYIIAKDELG